MKEQEAFSSVEHLAQFFKLPMQDRNLYVMKLYELFSDVRSDVWLKASDLCIAKRKKTTAPLMSEWPEYISMARDELKIKEEYQRVQPRPVTAFKVKRVESLSQFFDLPHLPGESPLQYATRAAKLLMRGELKVCRAKKDTPLAQVLRDIPAPVCQEAGESEPFV